MALIDPALPAMSQGVARPEQTRPAAQPVPHAALARLAALRDEAGRDLSQFRFLARAPAACLILMAAGAGLLVWVQWRATDTSLEKEFVWALWVLSGIAAITGLHIRVYASGTARISLPEAVTRLRRLLFYTGAAWGSGAFLVMPAAPVLAIGFAVFPSLVLSLLLGDQKGATAFTAPVILAASAASLGASGNQVAAAILAAGLAIFSLPMLQREISARREVLQVPGKV